MIPERVPFFVELAKVTAQEIADSSPPPSRSPETDDSVEHACVAGAPPYS
ncbi:hypothetical protein [Nocardia asiatica]|nr:hypothetical protein [Nocardia asiatica]